MAGAIDRVHFVRDTAEAPIAIDLVIGRARLWPTGPIRVRVRGLSIEDPMSLGSSLALTTDPICVHVRGGGLEESELFQELVHENYDDVLAGGATPREKKERWAQGLREQIDRALEIYQECNRLLEAGDPERRTELELYRRLAREELQKAGRELRALEQALAQES
ncbi:MAG TPA: hypothetical protein VF234_07775 [Limnochordia bacterium]